MKVLGKTLPGICVLVVKDSVNTLLRTNKTQTPGLLGMNIISGCYDDLFHQHGSSLFQTDLVRQAGTVWEEALSECHRIDCLSPSGFLGRVKVKGQTSMRAPAGTLRMIPASCTQQFGRALQSAMFEPDADSLPEGLLASWALLTMGWGEVSVPVVNLGTQDIWLPQHTIVIYSV